MGIDTAGTPKVIRHRYSVLNFKSSSGPVAYSVLFQLNEILDIKLCDGCENQASVTNARVFEVGDLENWLIVTKYYKRLQNETTLSRTEF